eukprot:TRINITY_DN30986_c0_g1_i1.p1 TRINITY_DN30986_c0_g1~~TRINITY_DN30986_c0_g1_i1.p1  ORF type:complete len:477 (-),score=86.15 TRINITY_DN30986_c0_g1_i1:34-1464(-)
MDSKAVLVTGVLSTIGVFMCLAELFSRVRAKNIQKDKDRYESELVEARRLLAAETERRAYFEEKGREDRTGRVRAEQALRNLAASGSPNAAGDPSDAFESFSFRPIGFIRSCFRDRNGTPRQGLVASNARATLRLEPFTHPAASLGDLSSYSHVWLLFVFHQNTNAAQLLKRRAINPKLIHKNRPVVKSLVRPPRLGGRKVGLFATRTPHRPNPLGLSVARLERIDPDGTLHLSGIDLVDGTPIVDLKPYVARYDSLPHATSPSWIHDSPVPPFDDVQWEPMALEALRALVPQLQFYEDLDSIRTVIDEVLVQDIRSENQRKAMDAGCPPRRTASEESESASVVDTPATGARSASSASTAPEVGEIAATAENSNTKCEQSADVISLSATDSPSSHVANASSAHTDRSVQQLSAPTHDDAAADSATVASASSGRSWSLRIDNLLVEFYVLDRSVLVHRVTLNVQTADSPVSDEESST